MSAGSERGDRLLDEAMRRWNLVPDGPVMATYGSRLRAVRHDGAPAMLKVALTAEEARGAAVMRWWRGEGAAHVLAVHRRALLLERATGVESLARMVADGRDDEATRIVCTAAARLHARRDEPPQTVVTLRRWFSALAPVAAEHGGVLAMAAETAYALLDAPRDVVVLHGDLHHGNVLDFGPARGWLAIDPKGLVGERAFDFANVLCNPTPAVATAPGRLVRQVAVIADAARVDARRMLEWVLAYAGLSAAWSTHDGDDPAPALAVASTAAAALGRGYR